jgi:hypothetical protein
MRRDLAMQPDAPFRPDQPFVIAFSVLDGTVAQLGGVEAATPLFGRRLAWILEQANHDYVRRGAHGAEIFELAHFTGARLTLALCPAERFAARHQWRVQFLSEPAYDALDGAQRAALAHLHARIAEVLTAAEETEDVDVVRSHPSLTQTRTGRSVRDWRR